MEDDVDNTALRQGRKRHMRKGSTLHVEQVCEGVSMAGAIGQQVLQVTIHPCMHAVFIMQ